jgi:hypothetical protein
METTLAAFCLPWKPGDVSFKLIATIDLEKLAHNANQTGDKRSILMADRRSEDAVFSGESQNELGRWPDFLDLPLTRGNPPQHHWAPSFGKHGGS